MAGALDKMEEREKGIKADAARFSVLGMLLVSALLLFVYRSFRVLALTLVPVGSGALAGIDGSG